MKSAVIAGMIAVIVFGTAASAQQANNARPIGIYGNLPLTFEANRGQAEPQVKFLSRNRGYTAYLTAGGMTLSLRPSSVVQAAAPGQAANTTQGANANLQFTLVGAAQNTAAIGEDPQPGRVNYFLGNDPSKWQMNVATYTRIRYPSVYPGIDLLFYGNRQQLEYDFSVQPGADPQKIEFQIQGAQQIQLDAQNNLVLKLQNGEIHFQSPVIYQESHGQRTAVSGSYVIKDATHIAFQVSKYDSNKPLVIDPALIYSTYLGGTGDDQPAGIAVDASGYVYVAGYTNSPDLGLTGQGNVNGDHVFVAKLDSTGSTLLYTDFIGGNGQDYGAALALDSDDNVYVTGSTTSSNFPTVSAYMGSQPGPYAGFVTKLSSNGSTLVYSTYLGGNTFDQPTSIGVDSLAEVHVVGSTSSLNFPTLNPIVDSASPNQAGVYGSYGFLTKFSADGTSLVYSTFLAGNTLAAQSCGNSCLPAPYSSVNSVTIDSSGNAYVAGVTNTNNYPTSESAYLAANNTTQLSTVGFVSKISNSGVLGYSTYLYGSSGNPVALTAIAVDGSGSAYVTGTADSDETFPVTSTTICNPEVTGWDCGYAFVTKLTAEGSDLTYSTFLGANNFASPQSIALDAAGDAYVAASTTSNSFQTSNAIEAYSSSLDLLLVEIDPTGSNQLFSTYLGGSGADAPTGLAVDAEGNIYVAGSTASSDFPVTAGASQIQYGGNTDAFIAKIGASSAASVTLSPSVLQYSSLQVGSTSTPQTVLVRNMSSMDLAVESVSTTGDFSEDDNCTGDVPAASTCTISITFNPTTAGLRTGVIQINDNGSASPQVINVSGTGLGALGVLTPAALGFGSIPLGTKSAAQSVTLTNQGNVTMNVGTIQASGSFAEVNTCGVTLAPTASCTINVTFTPTVTGTVNGSLAVNDSAVGTLQTTSMSGSGADFSLSSQSSTATISAGGTASYTIAVAPVGGSFNSAISLTCTGAPANSTCKVSQSTVTPGANTTNVTLTITTTASSSDAKPLVNRQQGTMYAAWLPLQGIGMFGIVFAGSKRGRKRIIKLAVLALLAVTLLMMAACAGGTGIAQQSSPGTVAGTYTVTMTGTSGSLQHSVPMTLTVQ
jgi:hypothetical protein